MTQFVVMTEYVCTVEEHQTLEAAIERLRAALHAIVADSGNAKRVDKLAREALDDRR